MQNSATGKLSEHLARATFGAGCFWGVQKTFSAVKGVVATLVGYQGGITTNPTYEAVCSKTTEHAEVIQIDFDPTVVSYESLLNIFWTMHNPTTMNRQGLDVGSQYRSVIFCHNEYQLESAKNSKDAQAANFASPIVTSILPAPTFYVAEGYHQHYLAKRA